MMVGENTKPPPPPSAGWAGVILGRRVLAACGGLRLGFRRVGVCFVLGLRVLAACGGLRLGFRRVGLVEVQQEVVELGQGNNRFRLSTFACLQQRGGSYDAAGGQLRNLRDVEAESVAANDRHPVRDFYVQGVDLAENVVDGRNYAVHRGLCQVDNSSEDVGENVHDILPRGSPVPGEYVLHKLDEVEENRFYIFGGCGYAAPPAGKVGGEQREVGLESRTRAATVVSTAV